jgi:hypothetical protein
MSLAGHIAYTEIVGLCKMLTGKTEGYRSLGKCSYTWEGMVTMGIESNRVRGCGLNSTCKTWDPIVDIINVHYGIP